MDINILRSIITVLSMVIFIGIVFFVYSRRNMANFEAAAQVPFLDEDKAIRSQQEQQK